MANRFAINPANVEISRSTFMRNQIHKTSFNFGRLIPIYVDEVYPGDTHEISINHFMRLSTPIAPTMDNAFIDYEFFFVPNRLVFENFQEMCGENKESEWTNEKTYVFPQITAPSDGFEKGTIADYMGIPISTPNIKINALPFRAYTLIYNEWFRDQNLITPKTVHRDMIDRIGTNADGDTNISASELGGQPPKSCKTHDYFTSCLPAPQKGPAITIPLGQNANVTTQNGEALKWLDLTGQPITDSGNIITGATGQTRQTNNDTIPTTKDVKPANLYADLSTATATTINALRIAFQVQKFYERQARGGTRYVEVILSHFGVTSPDMRQQRPEYLGGKRETISMSQVPQTSSTDATSPQGNLAAYSATAGFGNFICNKSFTEHGYIIGVATARTSHTYQQGIERFWSRRTMLDMYWPVFSNIGEMAVLNKEIYAQGNAKDDEVFGYQEAWADLRYKPNRTSGVMRSTHTEPLDYWHYGDKYTSQPFLSANWIKETEVNVDRTLVVTSKISHQIFGEILVINKTTRALPLYGIPGLIDHH